MNFFFYFDWTYFFRSAKKLIYFVNSIFILTRSMRRWSQLIIRFKN